jgi:hypothetical protein
MRSRLRTLLCAAAFAVLPAGCGTVVNLTAPPPSLAPPGIGPTACQPFGGVVRSGLLGGVGVSWGLLGGWQDIGNGGLLQGAWLAGMGLVALVDTPLSLAGDLVTWPIARARAQGEAWATWWGDHGSAELAGAGRPEPPPGGGGVGQAEVLAQEEAGKPSANSRSADPAVSAGANPASARK